MTWQSSKANIISRAVKFALPSMKYWICLIPLEIPPKSISCIYIYISKSNQNKIDPQSQTIHHYPTQNHPPGACIKRTNETALPPHQRHLSTIHCKPNVMAPPAVRPAALRFYSANLAKKLGFMKSRSGMSWAKSMNTFLCNLYDKSLSWMFWPIWLGFRY